MTFSSDHQRCFCLFFFCNRVEGLKIYPPNTGLIPKVTTQELYFVMVPSSPSDYVTTRVVWVICEGYMKMCGRTTWAVHEIKFRVMGLGLVVSRNFWYFRNKECLRNSLRGITLGKQLIQEINSLTLHTLLVYYNSFMTLLRNSFHDIVLLVLFYFLYYLLCKNNE